eukprot:1148563-Pelagomonas_calceolata.AAC.6
MRRSSHCVAAPGGAEAGGMGATTRVAAPALILSAHTHNHALSAAHTHKTGCCCAQGLACCCACACCCLP